MLLMSQRSLSGERVSMQTGGDFHKGPTMPVNRTATVCVIMLNSLRAGLLEVSKGC